MIKASVIVDVSGMAIADRPLRVADVIKTMPPGEGLEIIGDDSLRPLMVDGMLVILKQHVGTVCHVRTWQDGQGIYHTLVTKGPCPEQQDEEGEF